MKICLLDMDQKVVSAFNESDGFEVVAVRNTGDPHQLSLAELDPDVVILGHDRRIVTKWTAALVESLGRETEAAIVVRSGSGTVAGVSRTLMAGAQGFVLRSDSFETLCEAISAVAAGEVWVSESLRPMVFREFAELMRGTGAGDDGDESCASG